MLKCKVCNSFQIVEYSLSLLFLFKVVFQRWMQWRQNCAVFLGIGSQNWHSWRFIFAKYKNVLIKLMLFFFSPFIVGCSAVEHLLFPPNPFLKLWGQGHPCSHIGWTVVSELAREILLCCPFAPQRSQFPALSQASSVRMLFWSLLNVDVKQLVCPLQEFSF